jgi:hypothetical protein
MEGIAAAKKPMPGTSSDLPLGYIFTPEDEDMVNDIREKLDNNCKTRHSDPR